MKIFSLVGGRTKRNPSQTISLFEKQAIESGKRNIKPADTCGFHVTGDLVNQAPYRVPLADNGGPTETHWLQPNCPAINAIHISRCQLKRDQRGEPRPKHNGCDIGAVEVNQELLLPIILK